MLPPVNLGRPVVTSMPMVATSRPSAAEMSPFIGFPALSAALMLRPKIPSQKYWKFVNLNANFASGGATAMRRSIPMKPPMAEQSRSSERASMARPCLVSS